MKKPTILFTFLTISVTCVSAEQGTTKSLLDVNSSGKVRSFPIIGKWPYQSFPLALVADYQNNPFIHRRFHLLENCHV